MLNVLRRTINAFILKAGLEADMRELCTMWWMSVSASQHWCRVINQMRCFCQCFWRITSLRSDITVVSCPRRQRHDMRDVLLPSLHTSSRLSPAHFRSASVKIDYLIGSEKSRHPASSNTASSSSSWFRSANILKIMECSYNVCPKVMNKHSSSAGIECLFVNLVFNSVL